MFLGLDQLFPVWYYDTGIVLGQHLRFCEEAFWSQISSSHSPTALKSRMGGNLVWFPNWLESHRRVGRGTWPEETSWDTLNTGVLAIATGLLRFPNPLQKFQPTSKSKWGGEPWTGLEKALAHTFQKIYDTRSLGAPTSRLRTFGPDLGPSGLLDNVLQAVWPTQQCNDGIVCFCFRCFLFVLDFLFVLYLVL